jgi:hypothetical protein
MSNSMKAMGSDFAVDSGMGKGEYAGLAANMRAMVSGTLELIYLGTILE